jgi:protoporphyrin/coproporphyrin ferrochelatase
MSTSRVGVAVIAPGRPRSADDLVGFLTTVTGLAPESAALRAATERFAVAVAGDRAAVADPTAGLAAGLQARLRDELGIPALVRHGLLWGAPSVAQCLASLDAEHVVALPLEPFASRLTLDQYRLALARAEAPERGGRGRAVATLDGWCMDRGFARAVSRRIAEALDGSFAPEWALLFVLRSVPVEEIDRGDPVLDQLHHAIAQILPSIVPGGWDIACLGQGPNGRWLEPDPVEAARGLAAEGWKKLIVVPIGFVAEGLETLHDLDVLLRRQVVSLGLTYRRVRTLDDTPAFTAALADVVERHLALLLPDLGADQLPEEGLSPGAGS